MTVQAAGDQRRESAEGVFCSVCEDRKDLNMCTCL